MTALLVLCDRLCLFVGIIGRETWSQHRCGPVLAWQICAIVHPWSGK